MIRTIAIFVALGSGTALAEPAYVLQLPPSTDSVLIAETDTSTLHRYTFEQGRLTVREQRYMSVGQNGVGKHRAGDRRTPLGIYFVQDQLDTSGLHEKYGPIAFPLDYPNAWDRINQRTGDGIWIHGVADGDGRRPPHDTDGCIALPNDELLQLAKDVQLLNTPVIITRKIRDVLPAQIAATREQLNAALKNWTRSFRDGDWYAHLSLYAADFEYRGLDRNDWSAYRVRSSAAQRVRDVTITDVLLLEDPEDTGLFLSRFRKTIHDDEGTIVTIKRLYWRRSENGELRIVAEDNG
jgi:murein L,D-transpeptidase YafK